MAVRYKSIGLKESQYQALAEKKRAFEDRVGRKFDWATFLLILTSVRSVDELIGHGENIKEVK